MINIALSVIDIPGRTGVLFWVARSIEICWLVFPVYLVSYIYEKSFMRGTTYNILLAFITAILPTMKRQCDLANPNWYIDIYILGSQCCGVKNV